MLRFIHTGHGVYIEIEFITSYHTTPDLIRNSAHCAYDVFIDYQHGMRLQVVANQAYIHEHSHSHTLTHTHTHTHTHTRTHTHTHTHTHIHTHTHMSIYNSNGETSDEY